MNRFMISFDSSLFHLSVSELPELLDPLPREHEDGPGHVDDEPGAQLSQGAVAALEGIHIQLPAAHHHCVETKDVAGWKKQTVDLQTLLEK